MEYDSYLSLKFRARSRRSRYSSTNLYFIADHARQGRQPQIPPLTLPLAWFTTPHLLTTIYHYIRRASARRASDVAISFLAAYYVMAADDDDFHTAVKLFDYLPTRSADSMGHF